MQPSLEVQRRREQEFARARTALDVSILQARWEREDTMASQAGDHRERELIDLRKRVAKLEALTRPGGVFIDAMAEAVGKMVRQVRVDLEARIKAVEDRQLVFKGVHEPGRAYQPGNLVVRNGGLWHCNALTPRCRANRATGSSRSRAARPTGPRRSHEPHTIDELVEDLIRPAVERQVDQMIAEETDPEWRRALLHERKRIVDKLIDRNVIANLEHRLAEAEARRLRVVGEPSRET